MAVLKARASYIDRRLKVPNPFKCFIVVIYSELEREIIVVIPSMFFADKPPCHFRSKFLGLQDHVVNTAHSSARVCEDIIISRSCDLPV